MEEIDEKKLVEQVRAEFDLKLKAWDFVQSVKQAVENEDWTRYGDCPLIDRRRLSTHRSTEIVNSSIKFQLTKLKHVMKGD